MRYICYVNGVETPIVALSANTGPEFEGECRAAGMFACLAKPIDLAALRCVMASIGNARDEAAPPAAPLFERDVLDRLGDRVDPRHGERVVLHDEQAPPHRKERGAGADEAEGRDVDDAGAEERGQFDDLAADIGLGIDADEHQIALNVIGAGVIDDFDDFHQLGQLLADLVEGFHVALHDDVTAD